MDWGNVTCKHIDASGDGEISIEEFYREYRDNDELQNHFTIMGIAKKDIDELLKLMDCAARNHHRLATRPRGANRA